MDLTKPVNTAAEKVEDDRKGDRADVNKETVDNSSSIQRESKSLSKSLLSFLDQPSDDEEEINESAGNVQERAGKVQESARNLPQNMENLQESAGNIGVIQTTSTEIAEILEQKEADFAGTFSDSDDDEQTPIKRENINTNVTFVDQQLYSHIISGNADPRLVRKKAKTNDKGPEVAVEKKSENVPKDYVEVITNQLKVASKDPSNKEDNYSLNKIKNEPKADMDFSTEDKVIPETVNEGYDNVEGVAITGKDKEEAITKEDINDDDEFVLTVDLDYEDEMKEIVDKIIIQSKEETLPIQNDPVKANSTTGATNIIGEEDGVDKFKDPVKHLIAETQSSVDNSLGTDKISSVDKSFTDESVNADKSVDVHRSLGTDQINSVDKSLIVDKSVGENNSLVTDQRGSADKNTDVDKIGDADMSDYADSSGNADKTVDADKIVDADKMVDKDKIVDKDKRVDFDKKDNPCAPTVKYDAELTTDRSENTDEFSDDGMFSDDDDNGYQGGGTDAETDDFAGIIFFICPFFIAAYMKKCNFIFLDLV